MIYLDNNSTTRIADEVRDAMEPFLRGEYGNPSSLHRMGQAARNAIEDARAKVADMVHARPRDIVFTSGGTEADNLGILGTLDAYPERRHVVATAIEHPSIVQLCNRLLMKGVSVSMVRVNRDGQVCPDDFEASLRSDTAVAAVMLANNETGVILPIEKIAETAAAHSVPLHVDAVQAAGKIAIDVQAIGPATLALSAHKIHGPKGVGALYVAPRARLHSMLVGGHQERDLRPGTENVPAIVGFGAAAELAKRQLEDASRQIGRLRDRLESGILNRVPDAGVMGDVSSRVSNTSNIAFRGLDAEAILIGLSQKGVCASSGSACSSGSLEPSHVLTAMNIEPDLARGAIRFSLSRFTTEAEIDEAVEIVTAVVTRLRALSAG